MKKPMIVGVVLILGVVLVLSLPKTAYKIETKVSPGPEADQYDVSFVMYDVSNSKPSTICSPKMRVMKGHKGEISIEAEERQIHTCL